MRIEELITKFGYNDSPRSFRTLSPEEMKSIRYVTQYLRVNSCNKEQLEYLINGLIHYGLDQHIHTLGITNSPNLEALPENLMRLTALRSFSVFDGSKIKELPADIDKLKALEFLGIDHSDLETLPPALAKLNRLRELCLTNNKLQTVPAFIFNDLNLTKLTLTNNPITEFPKNIQSSTLKELDLGACKLKVLPVGLLGLTALKSLGLFITPIARIPNHPDLVRLAVKAGVGALKEAPSCIARMSPDEIGAVFAAEAVRNTLEAAHAERMGTLLWLLSNGYFGDEKVPVSLTVPAPVQAAILDATAALSFEHYPQYQPEPGTGQFFAATFFDHSEFSVSNVDVSKLKDKTFKSNLQEAKKTMADVQKQEDEIGAATKTFLRETKKTIVDLKKIEEEDKTFQHKKK